MRAALNYIERPILFAASSAMSFVFRKFDISPIRQVPGWEMVVAMTEAVVVTFVMAWLYRSGERSLVYVLPFMVVSMVFDGYSCHRKFSRISNRYDAQAYRKALTEAEENRTGGVFLRLLSLLLPVSAMVMFTSTVPLEYVWVGWAATLYFGLYASKFFVRACEPPRPDEGDYFAMPSATGSGRS